MFFLVLSENGTEGFSASSFQEAAGNIVQRYADAGAGFQAVANVAVVLPQFTGTVTPGVNGAAPTLVMNGDAATQQTIRNAAQNALANNATYLGLVSPTQAQVVAQVAALTRQVDALIRLTIGNFSGTG